MQMKGVVYAKHLEQVWHGANSYKLLAIISNRKFISLQGVQMKGVSLLKAVLPYINQGICIL